MSEITLVWIISILQILIALGLVNVWLVRSGRATKYRGAGAQNMKQEFAVYGLPSWFMYVVGFLKMIIAVVMIIGLFRPQIMYPIGFPALILLAVLMLGALSMHIKVRDPFIKMLPALLMLAMAVAVVLLIHSF
jgi:uncharacterized membrane protein